MKKILILIIVITCISYPVFSDKNGVSVSLSGFDYFSLGIGYSWCDTDFGDTLFSSITSGVMLEYSTDNEITARLYGQYCNGIIFGFSPLFVTDFDDYSFGFALEAGLGIPSLAITYRYNFYSDSKFNCHQIGILHSYFD